MSRSIVIMAGGTGGHVFPGLAVAHRLQADGWQIHWLGTPDRMEADLVPAHGFPIEFINIRGLRNHGLIRKLLAPFQICKAVLQALMILRRLKPDVVLGMGGYAAGPGGVAAKLLGIPLVLHEQNAAAGLTNRLLSKIATRILMGFEGAFPLSERARIVGNPVREEFLQLARTAPKRYQSGDPLKVLIVGGSLGARPLNQIVPHALAKLNNIDVHHQCGKGNMATVSELYQSLGVTTVSVMDFITDMAAAYEWADVLICRAGALTVAEVAAAGVPAIFIPLPHAVDDHQTRNAESLTRQGAAVLLPQKEMTADKLAALLAQWQADPRQLQKMAQLSRSAAILDATDRVVSECKALI
ncbi:undecaprenyldiphospho-muramoylpentapeptide beta-N-acetylglucosaminyltransferase [Tolumonas osonensis]|uniref:UDP-N-acetylglucosamine--N-acetylmuramyl-(pentapeptide) pyrophosphoryl-undecaprenol N-acetylglucosamine transferase n=1 Tax=Tolumonas osonensis TaxID=675874 RepID=A0A841GGJ1_9GAMM|nr:undecaprenyldiphospho-muramoylpentapeptide beta-N-acetylglucosaminyltransferase [Tolumonas osonensis]MBB6054371.1 UDP-N-acetylglucosamine--N-acetylmuramyl-(pentapeptide) pyrophosphoryl-undecaprenol N-acetylglucosamine transferase [Tolumonas osonensis]